MRHNIYGMMLCAQEEFFLRCPHLGQPEGMEGEVRVKQIVVMIGVVSGSRGPQVSEFRFLSPEVSPGPRTSPT